MPVAPRNSSSVATVITPPPEPNSWRAAGNSSSNRSVPAAVTSSSMPRRNPKSPIRLTMNAFFPASAAAGRSYQNPISRYEQSPTPSQPTNISRKLFASTSVSIANMNRLRYRKKRRNDGSCAM